MPYEILTKRKGQIDRCTVGQETLLQYKDVALTNAQLLALRATPVQLVALPGYAAKFLQFHSAVLVINTAAGAYVESAANLVVRQTGTTGVILSDTIEATGFCDGTAIKMTTARAKLDPIGALLNKALVLHNSGAGEWTGGNAANSLRVRCFYTIQNLSGWGTPA
jgi:hypothetical protein